MSPPCLLTNIMTQFILLKDKNNVDLRSISITDLWYRCIIQITTCLPFPMTFFFSITFGTIEINRPMSPPSLVCMIYAASYLHKVKIINFIFSALQEHHFNAIFMQFLCNLRSRFILFFIQVLL